MIQLISNLTESRSGPDTPCIDLMSLPSEEA